MKKIKMLLLILLVFSFQLTVGICSSYYADSKFEVIFQSKKGEVKRFNFRPYPVKREIGNNCLNQVLEDIHEQIFRSDYLKNGMDEIYYSVSITEDSSNKDLLVCKNYQMSLMVEVIYSDEREYASTGKAVVSIGELDQKQHLIQSAVDLAYNNAVELLEEIYKLKPFENSQQNNWVIINSNDKNIGRRVRLINDKTGAGKRVEIIYNTELGEKRVQLTGLFDCVKKDGNVICGRKEKSSKDIFDISFKKEVIISATGIVLLGVSLLLDNQNHALTTNDINALDRDDINSVDRFVMGGWNPKMAKVSDLLLVTSLLSPLLCLVKTPTVGAKIKYGITYLETLLLTNAMTMMIKNSVRRTRPFAYDDDAPMKEKLKRDAKRSFVSGHTSMAFASAVFFAKTYCQANPNSKYKPLVWGSAMSLATAVAGLRVASGKHYLTDVVGGAVLGTVIAYVVFNLHLKKKKKKSKNKSFWSVTSDVSGRELLMHYHF